MRNLLLSITVVLLMTACSVQTAQGPIEVEVVATATGFQLLRAGEPYEINGAGMAIDDLANFAAHGGNSIRTWTTGNDPQDTLALLDAAEANGVTVALCLPMVAERHGFDYDDAESVAGQLAAFTEEVLQYRNHPALLFWIIGNELNHELTNPGVYNAVNDIAAMIHELDPHHPTTTTTAGFEANVVDFIQERAPELDFISFQAYGSLFVLPEAIAEAGFEDPFMVTEWGAIGYWEMETTSWGTATEMSSSEKAGVFMRAQNEILDSFADQLLGSYVFLWGQKQERTPTWFGMFTDRGEATETVDVMHYIWNGDWPANRSPRVESLLLDGKTSKDNVTLLPGSSYQAVFSVEDHDGDPLSYRWELKRESDATETGGDFEGSIANIDGLLSETTIATTTLTAPAPGHYRLFAYAFDDQGHAAHGNIPFRVRADLAQTADDLVAGKIMAVAYSGFREGQHPDRGAGAGNPSRDEILEDLSILAAHDFQLIRLYDSSENTRMTLELIREYDLPISVLLGIWLRAEVSNHLGCPWLDEPIPDDVLAANKLWNAAEVQRGIGLAQEFGAIVAAVNVGNEALVEWNDHMVPLDQVIDYVREVKAAIIQPVTVADNYAWWIYDGATLAAEVDFIGVHSYPVWENKSIEAGLSYTLDNIEALRAALPDKPFAILEAGWATAATEFGERANEIDQARYFDELGNWAANANVTVFFFEAFDEPWKGNENDPLGAEKHWGLFSVDRTPKYVLQR
jgi:exo-beta-1,3-glucanase (GH17 family)